MYFSLSVAVYAKRHLLTVRISKRVSKVPVSWHTCVREQNVRDSVSRTLFEKQIRLSFFSSSENSCTKYNFFRENGDEKKEKKSFFSRPRKFSVSAHPESATPVVGRRPIGPIERVYLKTFPPHHHLCMRLRPSRYIHP